MRGGDDKVGLVEGINAQLVAPAVSPYGYLPVSFPSVASSVSGTSRYVYSSLSQDLLVLLARGRLEMFLIVWAACPFVSLYRTQGGRHDP